MHNRKLEIIQRLMPQVPMEYQQSIDNAMITWWANIRRDGGLRLTNAGYEMMHDVLRLDSWELDLSDRPRPALTKKLILEMDRKLEWPYYLDFNPRKKKNRVVFFSSREAMLATLYGDLESFLKQLG